MASSSSSEEYPARRPNRLARHDSSFLGTIKHIVTAPLTWFANQDDDDTPSDWGKRRRVPPSASPPADEEIISHRSKRMRIHSPPQAQAPPRRSSVVPRASSAVLPSSRATLSPRRQPPIARTMSIDPPRRDPSFNFAHDPNDDMDMIVDRNSRPPSPRPSFRMRASLTPQPQQPPARYISEPPPLNNLVSNPTFLRPPPSSSHEPSPAPTLGSIVESVRATKSPTRHQHSSLQFSSTAPEDNENKDAPAERALHLLDVYKTPLLPTRMRSSNLPASITATKTPDMFKSRRSANLILMQDDRDRNGRRVSGSGKSPLVNETKPYAGEGGMKKLLARRKQEEEEEENDLKEKDDEESTPRAREPSPSPAVPVLIPPIPSGSDWFSTAVTDSGPASGSSLRVGRAKTSRNHIQRPSKTRFSAVYDEEADDAIDDEGQKERQMLEEAAKKVPVFQIPAGFSFAKAVLPVQPADLENAKEPPIISLPFSFSKQVPAQAPPIASTLLEVPPAPVPARVPTPEPEAAKPAPTPAPVSGSGIPNFFASSSVLTKAKETPPPAHIPTLSFTSNTPQSSLFSFGPGPSTKNEPVKDAENPFWDGEKKKIAEEPQRSLFDGFGKNSDTKPVNSVPGSIFGTSASAFPSLPKPTAEAPSTLPFSFSEPATAAQGTAPSSLFGSNSAPESLKSAFLFGTPSEVKPQTETPTPKPLFDAADTPSVFGEASKRATSLFGDHPNSASVAPADSTSSSPSFSFGAAQSTTTTATPVPAPQSSFFGAAADAKPSVQVPKPIFGGSNSNGFSFGQSAAQEKEKETKASFSFGAPGDTPSTVESKPASTSMFSFSQPPAPLSAAAPVPTANPPQPIGFSFSGGGSASADVSNKSLFMFGQPSSTTPADRPVTPPKSNDVEFRMEESPTRDLQQVNGNKIAATSNGAFSFGTSGSSRPLFGGIQNPTSSTSVPSSFGGFGSSSSNPFSAKESTNPFGVKDNKAEEPKGFGGFGQNNAAPAITTSFSFGQPKPAEEVQRPSSGGGFSFGATSPAAATNQAFAFGSPVNTNPFGQPNTASAPSSPSTFNQPSPFAFGAPAPASTSNGAFSFGSQPASPAGGASLNLPQSSGGFGGGGFGQPQQPSSPFSAPIALAPSTSGGAPGGSLFTIGAAPAAAPAGGARQIKKLPTRRAASKR